jgi:hypothetical protein
MSREDESLDEAPGRLTHVIYNTTLGHVRVRAEDGPATTVEVPPGEVRFRRVLGASEPEVALWLGSGEREYLGRMLEHVLRALRITPEAREALQAIESKLGELGPPPIVADDGPDGDAAAAVPLVEEPPAAVPAREPVAEPERREHRGRGRAAGRTARAEQAADEPATAPLPAEYPGVEPTRPTAVPRSAERTAGANGAEPAAVSVDARAVAPAEGDLLAPGAADELQAASQAAYDAAVEADSGGRAVAFEQVWRDLTALQARG